MPDYAYNPPDVPLAILHHDSALLVVNKPAGLLSVPGKDPGKEDCLIDRLRRVFPEVLLVHRLDCDTSGVMVFALTKAAQGNLGQQFENGRRKRSMSRVSRGFLSRRRAPSICRYASIGPTVRASMSITNRASLPRPTGV